MRAEAFLDDLPDNEPKRPALSAESFLEADTPAAAGLQTVKPKQEDVPALNMARGAVERGGQLLGGLFTAGNAVAEKADESFPLGGLVWDDGLLPDYKGPEEYAKWRAEQGGDEPLKTAADHWNQTDAGYKENHTWERVKQEFGEGGPLSGSAWAEVMAYGAEQGVKSVPDMIAAMAALPAYITARSGEIGTERAKNKGKAEADLTDVLEAAPAAVGSALLERIGVKGITEAGAEAVGKEALKHGFGKLAREGAKAGGKEAGTEFLQEGIIEYLGEKLGTGADLSLGEALDRGAAGAVAGGVYGTGAGTAGAAYNTARNRSQARSEEADAAPPIVQDQVEQEAAQPQPTDDNAPVQDYEGRPEWANARTNIFRDGVEPEPPVIDAPAEPEVTAQAQPELQPGPATETPTETGQAADDLSPFERNQLRDAGVTDEQLWDMPTAEARRQLEAVQTPKTEPVAAESRGVSAEQFLDEADTTETEATSEEQAPDLTESGTGVFRVPVDRINVDPQQYQFRSRVNDQGVDKRLDGVKQWDDKRAGNVLLHRREDGSLYVADGHHRVDLARRLGQPELNARIVSEADGIDVATARVEAAMNNIADGKAEPLDVAKVFRDSGTPVAEVRSTFNLPNNQITRDGEALANLSDNVFGMVSSGQMTEKDGAAIGASFTETGQQEAAADAFQKVLPETEYQRQLLVNEIRAAEFAEAQGDQGGLFGDDPQEVSLMQDRLKVLDALRQRLNSDKRLFKSLNDNADRAGEAGNRIATEANEQITERSARSLDLISRVTTTPALNEMVNRAARRVYDGENRSQVVKDLKQELMSYEQGKTAESSRRPADAPRVRADAEQRQEPGAGQPVSEQDTARTDPQGQPESGQQEEVAPSLELESQTEAQLAEQARAQQEAEQADTVQRRSEEQRAAADEQVDGFTLTGSDRTADVAMAAGQQDMLSQAAAETDTNPTDAQKEAGNYKKGKVRIQGLEIAIENPKGSTRSGTDPDGNRWESTMAHHYGDIKGTTAADGDNLDVFIGPRPESQKVFVVDQVKPDGTFDEVKVMLGFTGKAGARRGYLSNYEKGWTGLGAITETSIDGFKEWLKNGNTELSFSARETRAPVPSRVSSLAADEAAVSKPKEQAVSAVRSQRNNHTPDVDTELQDVPSGRGRAAEQANDSGAKGQRQGVRARERRVGDNSRSGQEQAEQRLADPRRENDGPGRLGEGDRDKQRGAESSDQRVRMERGEGANNSAGQPEEQQPNADVQGQNSADGRLGQRNENKLQNAQKSNQQPRMDSGEVSGDADQVDRTEDVRFSRSGPRNLFVAHNLSEQNLEHVLELGGLAAPSLAVGRTDQGFADFGEITLLAPASMLESPKARTFDADVYTPRHPRAEYEIDRDAYVRQLKEMDNEYDLAEPATDDLERDGMEAMARSPAYQYSWLKSQGKAPKAKRKKVETVIRNIAKLGLDRYAMQSDPKVLKLAEAYYRDVQKQVREALGEDAPRANIYFDEDGNLNFNHLTQLTTRAAQYNESGGYDIGQMKVDLNAKLRPKLTRRRYERWIKDQFNEVMEGQRMFNGFTPSGNRRYKPYTLENVVKEMTRQVQGGEGFNYGAGSVRSAYTKEMKRISEVQANRDRIVSPHQMESIKQESNNRLQETLDALRPYYRFDADSWGYMDDASSAIAEGPSGWREAFELNEDSRAIIVDFVDYLRHLPTSYFETKVGRAVDLSEFSVAIVPKGTSKEVVEALRSKGLKVKRYDSDNPQSRRDEIAKQEDILFSRDGEYRMSPESQMDTLTVREAESIRDELMRDWKGAPEVIIRDSISEFPPGLQMEIYKAGAQNNMRGVLWRDTVYLLASRIPDRMRMEQVVLHEVIGHYGLRKMLGKGMERVLNQIWMTHGGQTRAKYIIDRYFPDGFDVNNKEHRHIVAEELIAHLAEQNRGQTLVQRAVAIIREGLRKLGFTLEFTVDDIVNLLRRSRQTVERGGFEIPTRNDLSAAAASRLSKAEVSQSRIRPLQSRWDGTESRTEFAERSGLQLPGDAQQEQARESSVAPEQEAVKPDDSGARFSRTGIPDLDPEPFGAPSDTLVRKAVSKIADKFTVLKGVQQNIKDRFGAISEDADAYMAEELFHGKVENDIRLIQENMVEPLTKQMSEYDISLKQLDEFLYAMHAPERNRVIAERNPKMPDGGSGMTNAEAAAVINKAEQSGKLGQYKELAGRVHGMLERRRQILSEAGLLDEDTLGAWEASYKHYVPLKGWAADEKQDATPRSGKGFSISGKESQMAAGRKSKAASPVANAISDLSEAVLRHRKNEVGNAFLNLVQAYPNDNYWRVYTDENPEVQRKVVRRKDPATGKMVTRVEEQAVPMAMMSDRYFTTKVDGETRYIKIEDERLMNAMRNLGPDNNGLLVRALGTVTRLMSSLNTSYNPEFVISNFSRDIQTALLNLTSEQSSEDGKARGKKIAAKTLKDVATSIRAINASLKGNTLKGKAAEWQKHFDQFRADGAKTGWFDMKDVDGQMKDLETMISMASGGAGNTARRTFKAVTDWVENTNAAIENGVRLSAYVNAIEAGIPRAQAASLAKNMTVNFNRRGELGTMMNALYMFANASVQGTANFVRTLGRLNGKKGDRIWRRMHTAQKIAVGMAVGGFAMSMLNRMVAGEDDDGVNWWDKVPDYVKERNIVIMKSLVGGEPGEYWTIPLPYGYNIFPVIGTSMEHMIGSDKSAGDIAGNVVLAALGSFSPIGFEESQEAYGVVAKNIMPTILRPVASISLNENFFGGPIYKENYPFGTQKPDSALYFRSTPEVFKELAKGLNSATGGSEFRSGAVDLSPDVMQFLVGYYGGGAYDFFTSRAPNAALKFAQGVELEDREIPFWRKVHGKVLPYEDQSKFYDRRNEINQLVDERDNLRGRERVEFIKEYRGKIRLQGVVKSVEKRLKALRKQRDQIETMGLSAAEEDQRLQHVERQMKRAIDQFNKRYNEAED